MSSFSVDGASAVASWFQIGGCSCSKFPAVGIRR